MISKRQLIREINSQSRDRRSLHAHLPSARRDAGTTLSPLRSLTIPDAVDLGFVGGRDGIDVYLFLISARR
jgi:hypothetical protein